MNDVNLSECKFNSEMVSYMYGELSLAESSAFERHLLDCSGCTDEFAAISSSRYEVYDWKKLEFDPLETPIFEIPSEIATDMSWSDRIRAAFSRGWSVPAVSFAAFAIVSVVAVGLIWNQSGNVEVDLRATTDPAPAKVEISHPVVTETASGTVEPTDAVAEQSNRRSVPKRIVPKNADAQPVQATRGRSIEAKQTTATNERRAVPRLNEYAEDDEDTSLRLAELLDDIGSR